VRPKDALDIAEDVSPLNRLPEVHTVVFDPGVSLSMTRLPGSHVALTLLLGGKVENPEPATCNESRELVWLLLIEASL
jgi:hypothetical protein